MEGGCERANAGCLATEVGNPPSGTRALAHPLVLLPASWEVQYGQRLASIEIIEVALETLFLAWRAPARSLTYVHSWPWTKWLPFPSGDRHNFT